MIVEVPLLIRHSHLRKVKLFHLLQLDRVLRRDAIDALQHLLLAHGAVSFLLESLAVMALVDVHGGLQRIAIDVLERVRRLLVRNGIHLLNVNLGIVLLSRHRVQRMRALVLTWL